MSVPSLRPRGRGGPVVTVVALLAILIAAPGPGPRLVAGPPPSVTPTRGDDLLPPPVPVAMLRARRAALRAAIGDGVAIVEARGGPEGDPVSRAFLHLTGLETPGAILLLFGSAEDAESSREILFLPERSPSWERWHGPRAAPGEESSRATGVARTLPLAQFDAEFTARVGREAFAGGTVWHLPVGPDSRSAPKLELTSSEERWRAALRERYPTIGAVEDVSRVLDPIRQVKDADELSRLRRAVAITGEAFGRAFAVARPGSTEFVIESAIEGTFRALGASGPGFDSIIGAGDRSCVLHYMRNDGPVAAGDVVVIDIGASWGGYTADITRTVPASGRYTARQREVFSLVARAQSAGIAAARPGATIRAVHRAAAAVFEEAGVARAFPHGTSHHVGLEVHDPGPLRRELEPGMVITVEPGLYFPDEGLGLRLEDMILITEGDPVILSAAIPRTPDAIENAIARARAGGSQGGDSAEEARPGESSGPSSVRGVELR